MAKPKHDLRILELARRGAESQVRALLQEIKYVINLFPDVRDSFDSDELPVSFLLKQGAREAARGAKRQPRRSALSAAARRAVSRRMKKYWAERRKKAKA